MQDNELLKEKYGLDYPFKFGTGVVRCTSCNCLIRVKEGLKCLNCGMIYEGRKKGRIR